MRAKFRGTNLERGPRVVMHTSDGSGFGHYVSALVIALANAHVPVVLFCPANSWDQQEVQAAGIEVVHAASRKDSPAGLMQRLLRNFRFLIRSALVQFRRSRRSDIVHFQGMLHLPLGFVFLFLAKLRGCSTVLTAHDPMPHRWRLPSGLRRLESGMLKLAYRLVDCVVVHNRFGKNVLVTEFSVPEGRIAIVPHGADGRLEDRASPYPAFECLRLLAFGDIRENKGLHLAIRAVQMAASGFQVPVRLTIAGRAHEAEVGYWEECKRLIAVQPEGIEVIDRRIREDELERLLARHHAVLLPYTVFFSESGVATLALSHCRPLLATAGGGLGELIEQGGCGIPIAAATPDSVARAIEMAIALGPKRLQKMGIEGNRFLRRMRSWDVVAHRTLEVYSRLASICASLCPVANAR
jgi:glycosyltransferase involved in cell wall biosynthesis